MNTIARKLSISILMAAASTTALTIGATTTLAVSNAHTHQFQLMGNDDKDFSRPSSSNEFDDFNSAQYAWSHPHHHHSSMIANYNGHNSNSTGSNDFTSAQYAWSHPHHHRSSMVPD